MRIKKNNRFLLIVLLVGLVLAVGLGVAAPRFLSNKSQKAENNAKYTEVQQLADALQNDPKYRDKESQAYKEARQRFCLLSARSVEQREKVVANIREFLGKLTVDVDFICSKFEGSDYTKPKIEYYNAALFGFTVDPKTNYIVEVRTEAWEGSRWGTKVDGTRWFENMPEYDYSGRYSTPGEVKKIAEKFLIDHKDIFGIDITKMTYQFEGRKVGNFFVKWIDKSKPYTNDNVECGDVDQKREGAYQNDQGVWCLKSTYTRYPTVNMTIMQSGQVAVYDNDGWEIEKL